MGRRPLTGLTLEFLLYQPRELAHVADGLELGCLELDAKPCFNGDDNIDLIKRIPFLHVLRIGGRRDFKIWQFQNVTNNLRDFSDDVILVHPHDSKGYMTRRTRPNMPDLYADPFRERSSKSMRLQLQLLGARIQFESNSPRLLRLVRQAYAGLPRHRLSTTPPKLTVKLMLRPSGQPRPRTRAEPAALDMFSGAGWLAAATQASDFVVLCPSQRTALVVVSPQTLLCAYHTRYELIEFAVFTLAARTQRLASLHAACVGLGGRGILLMGPSGSGKSTVTMMSLLNGLEFLSEDSVFVAPGTLRATGVANFLHVRSDSLRWLEPRARAAVRRSPVIRRRSGVRKYELDLRQDSYPLARSALQITALVFLSERGAGAGALLKRLPRTAALSRLAAEQAYAANQPGWEAFSASMSRLPAYELRRGAHPAESVEALRSLLAAR